MCSPTLHARTRRFPNGAGCQLVRRKYTTAAEFGERLATPGPSSASPTWREVAVHIRKHYWTNRRKGQ